MNHQASLDPAMNKRSNCLSSPEGGKKNHFSQTLGLAKGQRPQWHFTSHALCGLSVEGRKCLPFLSKCWSGEPSPIADGSLERMISMATLYSSLGPHCPFGDPSHVNTWLQAILQMWHFISENLPRGHMDNILKLQERKKRPTEAEPHVQGQRPKGNPSCLVDRDLKGTQVAPQS